MRSYENIINFIKSLYKTDEFIPLHAPVFYGNEKKYLINCIDSTFVSYVGEYVTKFEQVTAEFTGAKYAVAVTNGTVALQIALLIAGVKPQNEVLTQALTFVATSNAIKHSGAEPVYIDVDKETMGMSPDKLENWITSNTKFDTKKKCLINKNTNNKVSAIVPVHIFGHPCRIDEIVEVANKYGLLVIEDSAESLGSTYKDLHTGCFGDIGILSYNGNKTITTGGGGMLITNNEKYARLAKHITTTAKVPHKWEYVHDLIGFNFRLPNVNAAIGFAQMEKINSYLKSKRETAQEYINFFKNIPEIEFMQEPKYSKSNYWLNTIKLENKTERDRFLQQSNDKNVMCRPNWQLMNRLDMYENAQCDDLINSSYLTDRLINIPSSVR